MTFNNFKIYLPFLGADGQRKSIRCINRPRSAAWRITSHCKTDTVTERKRRIISPQPLLRTPAWSPSKNRNFTPSKSPFLKTLKAFATPTKSPRVKRLKNKATPLKSPTTKKLSPNTAEKDKREDNLGMGNVGQVHAYSNTNDSYELHKREHGVANKLPCF